MGCEFLTSDESTTVGAHNLISGLALNVEVPFHHDQLLKKDLELIFCELLVLQGKAFPVCVGENSPDCPKNRTE